VQQRVNAEQFVVETNDINARRMERLLSTGEPAASAS
jgi:hypothetical protein